MIIPVVAVGVILLGKAFDLYHVNPTEHQIIDINAIEENLQVIPQSCSEKHYRIVKSASDLNYALRLNPFVSLKAKNGDTQLVGLDSYLNDVVNRNKTVEIVIVVNIETETISFPLRLPVSSGWQDKPQSEVGTHFVSSIRYGGLLVASVVISPLQHKHLAQIQKAVDAKIPKSGAIDELFFRDLEAVIRTVRKKATVTLNVASTAGNFSVPANLSELAKLVREYPEIVRQVNEGKGSRLRIELGDIHRVQANYSRFEVKRGMEAVVEEANEVFEDLRLAEKIYTDFNSTSPVMSKGEEELMQAYWVKLQASKEALSSAIANLHYDGEIDQLEEAFAVYNELKVEEPYRYTYTIQKCIHFISDKSVFGRFYVWFIRWMKTAVGL